MSQLIVALGERVEGRLEPLPVAHLTESVPNQLYEIHLTTKPIPTEKMRSTAILLWEEIPAQFNIKIQHVKVEPNRITLQLHGSPFPWTPLLAFLPQILMAIGVIVTAIAVFLVITWPKATWTWALLATGIILIATPILIGRLKR